MDVPAIRGQRRWNRAAATVERALHDLPTEAEAKRLCLTDLPDNDGGAFVMRVGFPLAVRLFTDREHTVRVETRATWTALRDESLARGMLPAFFQRWDSERGWTSEP